MSHNTKKKRKMTKHGQWQASYFFIWEKLASLVEVGVTEQNSIFPDMLGELSMHSVYQALFFSSTHAQEPGNEAIYTHEKRLYFVA